MSRKDEPFDDVKKPEHYNSHPSGVETVDVNEWFSGNVAAAIKYVWRKDHKEPVPLRDLRKCEWYLSHERERLLDPSLARECATYFMPMSEEAHDRLAERVARVVMSDEGPLASVLSALWIVRDSYVTGLERALLVVRAAIEAAEKEISP